MPSDPIPVYLAEYQCLRTETVTHFTFANALIGLEVAAIGVSATLLNQGPILFAGFTALTSVIWVSYMDHIASIHRIALYVGTQLRDKIESATSASTLEWESWLRQLRSTGVSVSSHHEHITERGTEPRLGLTYPSIFYGGTAITFLLYSVYRGIEDSQYPSWSLCLAQAASALSVIFSIIQGSRLSRLMQRFDRMLVLHTDAEGIPEP
jgi:hypothetical protein